MSKFDLNKVAKQLYRNHTSAWVFSCKFAAYFQNTLYLIQPLAVQSWSENSENFIRNKNRLMVLNFCKFQAELGDVSNACL